MWTVGAIPIHAITQDLVSEPHPSPRLPVLGLMFRRPTSKIWMVDIERLTSGLLLIEGVCAMSLAIRIEGLGSSDHALSAFQTPALYFTREKRQRTCSTPILWEGSCNSCVFTNACMPYKSLLVVAELQHPLHLPPSCDLSS